MPAGFAMKLPKIPAGKRNKNNRITPPYFRPVRPFSRPLWNSTAYASKAWPEGPHAANSEQSVFPENLPRHRRRADERADNAA